ncbi:MAG: hypothetical protein ACK4NY_12710 [Spirosomataceae bacterium]
MMTQTEATIYLSERRIPSEIGLKTELDGVVVFDNILAPNQSYELVVEADSQVLVLPYIGDLEIVGANLLEENQIQFFTEIGNFKIQNPYTDDAINFFEIHIQNQTLELPKNTFTLDFTANLNQLISISDKIQIGQFGLREEGVFTLQNPENKVFVYAIEGAFEAQNRLIQPRDGLQLQFLEDVEFEALSDNAIILFIELNQ